MIILVITILVRGLLARGALGLPPEQPQQLLLQGPVASQQQLVLQPAGFFWIADLYFNVFCS